MKKIFMIMMIMVMAAVATVSADTKTKTEIKARVEADVSKYYPLIEEWQDYLMLNDFSVEYLANLNAKRLEYVNKLPKVITSKNIDYMSYPGFRHLLYKEYTKEYTEGETK